MIQHIRYSKNIFLILQLLDLVFFISFFLLFLKYQYLQNGEVRTIEQLIKLHYKALILFIFSWCFISINTNIYKISRLDSLFSILKNNLYQTLLFSIIVFAVSGFKTSDLFSPKLSIIYLAILFFFTSLTRIFLFILLKIYRSLGGNIRKVIFIDENSNTQSFINLLSKRKDYGFVNYGIFLFDIKSDLRQKRYNFDLNDLKCFLLEENIQIIFFSLNGKLSESIQDEIVLLSQKCHIDIRFIPNTLYDPFNNLKLKYYDTFPILTFDNFPLDKIWNRILKRIFDIVFSLFIIVFVFSWLFPIIIIIILIDSGKPIFYLQKRVGLYGKIFYCYKFRTMKKSKENDIKATVKGDSRITRIGKILRKTSLDELPQFFNVLFGNMSVVGPRPHMVLQDEYYSEEMRRYTLRHYVKPGITGLAQIKGFRGQISSKEDIQKRIISDIYYIKNWSFILDIFIIIRTFFKTVGGDKKAF